MISNKMHQAIRELSALSATAKAISDRLNAGLSTPVPKHEHTHLRSISAEEKYESGGDAKAVIELQQQIHRLDALVVHLREIIEDDVDAVYTDAQAEEFTQSLALSLKELQPSIICSVYGHSYMSVYPKNLRALMSTVLINHFSSINAEPLPLWRTLMASNGFMQI